MIFRIDEGADATRQTGQKSWEGLLWCSVQDASNGRLLSDIRRMRAGSGDEQVTACERAPILRDKYWH
jgi:hypothetical protein